MPAIAKTCSHCGKSLLGRWFMTTPGGLQLCRQSGALETGETVRTCDSMSWTLRPGHVRLFNAQGALVNESAPPLHREKMFSVPAGKPVTITPPSPMSHGLNMARVVADLMQQDIESKIIQGSAPLPLIHDDAGTTGTWMGISRSTTPIFSSKGPDALTTPEPRQTDVYKALLRQWSQP